MRLSNLWEKISVDGHVGYNYYNAPFDRDKLDYESLDFDNQEALNIEALLGYTVVQKKEMEDMQVTLKAVGNTTTVSDLPCRVITSYIIRGGYFSYDYFMSGRTNSKNTELMKGNYEIFQKTQNILLGVVRKISVDSKFKTDKYGIAGLSFESEIFFDLILNFENKFPQINELEYLNSTYSQEVTGKTIVPYDDQNLFRSHFYRIPVGFRLGWRSQTFKNLGFYYGFDAGVYPGSYSSILLPPPVALKLSLGYRFMNKIK